MRMIVILFVCLLAALLAAACENRTLLRPLDADQAVTDDGAAVTDDISGDTDDLLSDGAVDEAMPDEAADEERPDGDTLDAMCLDNGDCSEGLFCLREAPTPCEGTGNCALQPVACGENYEPVCGCDGKSYPSECAAWAAGMNIRHGGPCGSMLPCTANKQCTETEYCAKPIGVCDADAAGTCDLRPIDCDLITAFALVCGCDDTTYLHPCHAAAAGVTVSYPEKCAGENICLYNDECGDTEFCRKAEGVCGQSSGACDARPEACPFSFDIGVPVCGCDGITYADECAAWISGMNIAFSGACEDAIPKSYLTYSYRKGDDPEVTAHIFAALSVGETVEYAVASVVEKDNTGIANILLKATYGGVAPGDEAVMVQLSLPRTANVPYAVTIDGGANYVRWLDAMGMPKADLVGTVTITLYETDNDFPNYTVTAVDFFGENLVPKP